MIASSEYSSLSLLHSNPISNKSSFFFSENIFSKMDSSFCDSAFTFLILSKDHSPLRFDISMMVPWLFLCSKTLLLTITFLSTRTMGFCSETGMLMSSIYIFCSITSSFPSSFFVKKSSSYCERL